jgi:catechol 2,3-dioxygenase-like lactoylglutathione lyase family enzyme
MGAVSAFDVEGIDHVALWVRDVDRSRDWYVEVLGLEHLFPGEWGGVPTMIGRGGTALALFPAWEDAAGPPGPTQVAMSHLAFRVSPAQLGRAAEELRSRGLEVVEEDHGIARSIYFRDPDGHRLELTAWGD